MFSPSIGHNTWRSHWPIALLVITAMIGPGISYGPIYLFHLVLPAIGIHLFRSRGLPGIIARIKELRLPMVFLAVTLIWYGLSVAWAVDRVGAVRYLAILSICVLYVFLLLMLVRDRTALNVLLFSAGAIVAADVLLGLLETYTDLRWPISRYSFHAHLFGRENDLHELIITEKARAYVLSSPTGFHWNSNHYSTVLAFAFPFAVLLLPRMWALLIGAAMLLLVGAAGARLAFLAMIIMALLLIAIAEGKRLVPFLLVLLTFATFTVGPAFEQVWTLKVAEMSDFIDRIVELPKFFEGHDRIELDEGTSPGRRKHASMLCFAALQETMGLGLGGGNSRWYLLEHWAEPSEPISDPHNWWVEVLAEGGILYAIVHFGFWALLWLRMVQRWLQQGRTPQGNILPAVAIAIIGAVPAGISPSSMVYFLPLYTLLAIAILVAYPSKPQTTDR